MITLVVITTYLVIYNHTEFDFATGVGHKYSYTEFTKLYFRSVTSMSIGG